MTTFVELLRKDFRCELRAKETATLLVSLALLLSVLCALGVENAFLEPAIVRKIFPLLVWLAFVFSATVAVGKVYDAELEHRAHEGLLLAGAPPALLFLSKFTVAFVMTWIGLALCLGALAMLLDVRLGDALPALAAVSALTAAGYSALAVLLGALAAMSRLRGMMLSLLLLPLLFPIFFAAFELSYRALIEGAFDTASPWFTLLGGIDLLYLALGVNLYEHALKE